MCEPESWEIEPESGTSLECLAFWRTLQEKCRTKRRGGKLAVGSILPQFRPETGEGHLETRDRLSGRVETDATQTFRRCHREKDGSPMALPRRSAALLNSAISS